MIKRLNPMIRGWAAYYRTQVSSKTFGTLDQYLWQLTDKWAAFSHPNTPTSWVITRYFGPFNQARRDRWVFGDRASGAYLHRFAWTHIARHQIVRYQASPDDPALTDYWAWRRHKAPLPINNTNRWLLKAQDGRCPICKGTLHAVEDRPQTPADWERWLVANPRRDLDDHGAGDRHDGRDRTPSHTRRLPRPQRPGTSARPQPIRACLSRMHQKVLVRF